MAEDAKGPLLPPPTPVPLENPLNNSAQLKQTEDQVARHAWQYFQVTQDKSTGLFESVLGYPHATMWDIASGLAAEVAADKLKLIGHDEFLRQMRLALDSLTRMPLYRNELPNREYDIRTLKPLDGRSRASLQGSGWSAIDLGRLMIWLKIISNWYPELQDPVQKVTARWRRNRLIKNHELQGTLLTGKGEHLRQEGRLGYEQYAKVGVALWDTSETKRVEYSSVEAFDLFGIVLMRDKRKPAFLTSEPFFLARMELGPIDAKFDELTEHIYEVQRRRWQLEGVLTAVTEDAVNQEPWFVYNSIFTNGKSWACVSISGKEYPRLRTLSTKAAVAWWAIEDDAYSQRLFEAVKDFMHPSDGYYSGIFEDGSRNLSRNLNTNAVVLEAILYRRLGRRPFLAMSLISQDKSASAAGRIQ